MSNKYLEKIASTRLVKELAKGLSASLPQLVQKGALRSANTYAKGMRIGNANLSRISNVVHTTAWMPEKMLLGSMASQGGGATSIPLKSGKTVALTAPDTLFREAGYNRPAVEMTRRHEIHEGREYGENLKNGSGVLPKKLQMHSLHQNNKPMTGISDKAKTDLKRLKKAVGPETNVSFINKKDGQLAGAHRNLAVLGREANDARTNPYLHFHKDVRKSTGESALLKRITGKEYGKDKFSNKDLSKLRNAIPEGYHEFGDGTKMKKFVVE